MNRLLLAVGIAVGIVVVGMNAGVALAQGEDMPAHESMPGHDNMPAGEHQHMRPGDHAKHTKKKQTNVDKSQPPKAGDQKHEGPDQP